MATSSSSLIVATPFLLNIDFIMPVANAFIPGMPVMTSGMGTGMGMAGLPVGATRSFFSKSL